ncbi:MAG TPA: hypothetical protein VG317_11125, partial [Pseudonocardiaceae bacterium]|nr:hypothetical protein [Pseudonocardiaceae bacterium]
MRFSPSSALLVGTLAVVAGAGLVPAAQAAGAPSTPPRAAGTALVSTALVSTALVSSDPFTDSDAQHATEVEPDTFAYGTTIVAAQQVGRVYDGGASD